MSAVLAPPAGGLAREILEHLDGQIASARHLLSLVLAQGRAIRARDVDGVLARLGGIQAEVERRGQLEVERTRLLNRAGAQLGLPPTTITLEQMTRIMAPGEAQLARERSAELTGLLQELAREHGINRALMRQELSFLSHLTRLIGGEPEGGYRPPSAGAPMGAPPAPGARPVQRHRLLDLQA